MGADKSKLSPYPIEYAPGASIEGKIKVAVGGGGGFIGSWLALDLKKKGFYVVCADWKRNEFMEVPEFCELVAPMLKKQPLVLSRAGDEFHLCDLRVLANCVRVCDGCRDVYNLAADMGGMGFIKSNESVLMFNNTMISFNVLEAARLKGVKRYFYSSSACVYNDDKQLDPNNPGLKEGDAWPAKPQDTYGLEKLYAEEMGMTYGRDFGIKFRCARFHNVYGPRGTWKGGREKAPAAFCRKAVMAMKEFEMWGDGKQTRSFMFIDDCVDGIQRIMDSDCDVPLNLGSDEMIDMNAFARLALTYESKEDVTIKHIPGPEGVRGRNSDNTMISEKLGWAPSIPVKDGLKKTYFWIKEQIEKEKQAGNDVSGLGTSEIVVQSTDELEKLAAAK